MKTVKRTIMALCLTALLCCLLCVSAYATGTSGGTGDVASAVESTWATASGQIKTVVDNVVFPAIDLILAVFFFIKLGLVYFDFRKTGHFECTGHPFRLSGVYPDRPAVCVGHYWNLNQAMCT